MTQKEVGDFWAQVEKREDGHWIWKGRKTTKNYGRVMIKGKEIYTHRLSYALTHGYTLEQIEHLRVIKICKIRECISPAHLVEQPKQ